MLSVAAFVSAVVWLVVVVLFVMAWVDDRRREDDEILRQSKLGGWSQRSQPSVPAAAPAPAGAPVAEDHSLV
jgi:hypothetical protein